MHGANGLRMHSEGSGTCVKGTGGMLQQSCSVEEQRVWRNGAGVERAQRHEHL